MQRNSFVFPTSSGSYCSQDIRWIRNVFKRKPILQITYNIILRFFFFSSIVVKLGHKFMNVSAFINLEKSSRRALNGDTKYLKDFSWMYRLAHQTICPNNLYILKILDFIFMSKVILYYYGKMVIFSLI